MLIRQLILALKRYCTAMIFLAAGLLIAFSTAYGKELAAELNESPTDPSATKTNRTGKEGSETSENDGRSA